MWIFMTFWYMFIYSQTIKDKNYLRPKIDYDEVKIKICFAQKKRHYDELNIKISLRLKRNYDKLNIKKT